MTDAESTIDDERAVGEVIDTLNAIVQGIPFDGREEDAVWGAQKALAVARDEINTLIAKLKGMKTWPDPNP